MELRLIAFLLVIILPTSRSAGEPNNDLLERSFPVYGLAATSLRIFNGSMSPEVCPRELELFRRAVDDRTLWALKMLDASGVPKPGFVYGNKFWLGVRSQCLDLQNRNQLIVKAEFMKNNTLYRDVREEFPPFELKYFVAHFRHNSTLQYHIRWVTEDIITLGLCLPASCTINELDILLKSAFQENILIFNDLYSTSLKLVQVKDLKDDYRWLLSAGSVITLLAIGLLVLLVITGTLYEFFHKKRNKGKKSCIEEMEIHGNNNLKLNDDPDESELIKEKEGFWDKILLSFSAYKNTILIFNTKTGNNSIRAIHGLRFLGMIWITLAHLIFFRFDFYDNNVRTWRLSGEFILQPVSNASLSVDSYFFISGFLVAYIFYTSRKDDEKMTFRRGVSYFFVAVLRRFIRLTPAYMMVLGIVQLNGAWTQRTSQFYPSEQDIHLCPKYWWRNLLYINNLFPRDTMCMSWSWYLSNDMQFYIVGLILLFLSTSYFYVASLLLVFLILFSIGITGYTVYAHNFIPTLDEQYYMANALYDPPWTRIGPYLVGMVTGYIIVKLNGKLPMSRKWVAVCWTLGSLCNLITLFGIYDKQISLTKSIFYISLCRTAWALGLAWLLIACCTKHGGIVNKILCFKLWIPFSKLTYCAYLLNPLIIYSLYLHKESTAHMEVLSTISAFCGILMMTYMSAYVLSLALESPVVLLMRKFINEKRR